MFLASWFSVWYIIYPIILFLIFVGFTYVLSYIRQSAIREINRLLYVKQEFDIYQEFLENKRLKLIFSKGQLQVLRLNGAILGKNDELAKSVIYKTDKMKLKPYERLDFYQKRFSFFVEEGNKKEANISLENLKTLLGKNTKKEATEILEEAKLVYSIYIEHDTSKISVLVEKSELIKEPLTKGINYFRIAKLFHFKSQKSEVKKYLFLAKPFLENTYYEDIVISALKDESILDIK